MQDIQINIQFSFFIDPQKNCILHYIVTYKNTPIPLSLAELMQYIYAHEDELNDTEKNICFFLAKVTKKFTVNDQLLYGIKHDNDMGRFFHHVLSLNIPCQWKYQDQTTPLNTTSTLPISLLIEQKGHGLKCSIQNKSELTRDVTSFLLLRHESDIFCFSQGIVRSLTIEVEDFIGECMDRDAFYIEDSAQVIHFIKTIYQANKNLFNWTINANFDAIVPKEITPVPFLKVTYENQCLMPVLSFQYNNSLIPSDFKEDEIIDRVTGRKMIRMPSMESIYQDDLMSLFQEYNLPFMLTNPGDIAIFLDKILSELERREWTIHNEVDEFKVHSDPVTLEFSIDSSGTDWFHFNPNCSILDQNMSLQEMARLIVENQGYVKTKKGFVKVSSDSQKELSMLHKMDAFKVGKRFNQRDILPLVFNSTTKGTSESAQSMIDQLKSYDISKTPLPKDFKGELRSYQAYGVHWMSMLAMLGQGGILADDMGLGKTVQTLAFTARMDGDGPVIVACPTSVVYNWQSEINKFLPKKSSIVYAGSQRHKHLEKLIDHDYIIVSYGILKNDIDWLSSLQCKAIIIDEAQYMKNPKSQISQAIKQLQGQFKLVMTGTPIENHIHDIWNLFDFVLPDYLGSKSQFDLLLNSDQTDLLKARIKPFILRREKREVLDSLPEKTEIILKCPLSDQQFQLYEMMLEAVKKGVKIAQNKRNKLHMLTALLKLRQVCTHPSMIEEFQCTGMPSAKFDILKEKIDELMNDNHKVVVFSQFTKMLDIIQEWLESNSYGFERIDGSITGQRRMDAINRFQSSKKPEVFLVSLKAGGVGINLTAADYVIHVDPWWNPAIESQATDRVHRMGQKNKVIVYKLICEGTIEEKIQELQESKKQLLSEVVDIDGNEAKKIDLDEIKELVFS